MLECVCTCEIKWCHILNHSCKSYILIYIYLNSIYLAILTQIIMICILLKISLIIIINSISNLNQLKAMKYILNNDCLIVFSCCV